MKKPFIRSAHNYDMNKASLDAGLKCEDKSLARQEFAEESNINYIAERYGLTGELPQVLNLPKFGDFTGIYDFQSAQNAVITARAQFLDLPAKIRARFKNDPQELLQFLSDPENRAEAEFLGLVEKRPETPPTTPEATPAPQAKGNPTPAPAAPEGTPKN